MTLKKKRILSFLAIICIIASFVLRWRNEQQPLIQICPALSSPNGFSVTLESGENSYESAIDDGQLYYCLKDVHLKRGEKTALSPAHSFRIVVVQESGNWLLTVGADHSVTAGKLDNLEKTRTLWTDPTGELFDTLYNHHLCTGGTQIPGYVSHVELQNINFAKSDFSSVNSIRLTNCHNGHTTYLTPEAIREVTAFIQALKGKDGISAKGYYEGSYSLTFIEDKEEVFSIGFGDTHTFHYGDYGDGYPVRYTLDGIGIEEVTKFLAQYDAHGIS